jgi:cytochrome P450
MTNDPLVIRRHADVRAVLSDPRFEVPAAAPTADGTHGMPWLRGAVSRFSNGAEHARRRSHAIGLLSAIDIVALRGDAFDLASAELASSEPSRPSESNRPDVVDVMARLARRVPVGVLATHLGIAPERREEAVGAVITMAAAYHPRPHPVLPAPEAEEHDERADRAVGVLADLLGHPEPERLAAVAALLIQACDATAGLIGNALNLLTRLPHAVVTKWPAEAILAETLRHDPPVRLTRRVATEDMIVDRVLVPAGTVVVLDLAAANRDPDVFRDPHRFDPDRRHAAEDGDGGHAGCPQFGFGAGIRPCPGDAAALALAAGVVEAATGWALVNPEIHYEPSPNLRVPARFDLRRPCPRKRPTDAHDQV